MTLIISQRIQLHSYTSDSRVFILIGIVRILLLEQTAKPPMYIKGYLTNKTLVIVRIVSVSQFPSMGKRLGFCTWKLSQVYFVS